MYKLGIFVCLMLTMTSFIKGNPFIRRNEKQMVIDSANRLLHSLREQRRYIPGPSCKPIGRNCWEDDECCGGLTCIAYNNPRPVCW